MPDPLFPGRVGLYLSMLHYGLGGSAEFAREHCAFFLRMQEYLGSLRGQRILDLGCGKSYWLTLLLASAGADATGIDVELTAPGANVSKYLGIARRNGTERALRTLAWDVLFARPYYRELARLAPFRLDYERVRLRAYDGRRIPFADHSFDVVVSHEVLEHVEAMEVLVGEIRRVLRPGGRTYLYVHNWTSVSGGHHIAWKHADSKPSRRVPPWDHLRANRWPDVPSYLNRLREQDYRRMFEREFDVLDWFATAEEGRTLLTPEIRAELSDYTERELLTKGFVIVATPARGAKVLAA